MNELVLWKLVDMGITAFAAKLERDLIVGTVRKMEEEGASPVQITAALEKLAADSEAATQGKIDRA